MMLKKLSKAELQDLINQFGYVEFWDDKDFMSNFYRSEFEYNGHILYCSEQLFMIKKAEAFKQSEYVDKIIKAGSPNAHPMVYKKIGRSIPGWETYGETWEKQRYNVMIETLKEKFKDPKLKEMLINTGDKVLIEASKYDGIWGVKLPKGHEDVKVVERWKGTNLLGFALMEVRSSLK